MQTDRTLLDTIQRYRGDMHRHQQILSSPRNCQYGQRLLYLAHTYSTNIPATDVYEKEIGYYRYYDAWWLVGASWSRCDTILTCASSVCAASVVRIHFLNELTKTVDLTRAMGPVFIWSDLEPCIAIVSACLPHLAPLRHVIRDRVSSTFGSKRGKGTDNSANNLGIGESSSKGPMFTYGGSRYFGRGDKLKLGDNDDEVELTGLGTDMTKTCRQTSSRPSSAENSR